MHAEISLSASTLLAFALVLARMAGAFVFIPMPINEAGPNSARIILALACAVALFPVWPQVDASDAGLGRMTVWLVAELALGTAIGLMVSFITEALTTGARLLSFQAGYAYASTVDPITNADSDSLSVLARLLAGLLFFTTGLDRYVIKAFALSMEKYPPGAFSGSQQIAQSVIALGSNVFSIGVRLAFPVLGLLLMTELAFALVGRLNTQFHLGMHAFPAKMLLALGTLAAILAVVPVVYQAFAGQVLEAIRRNFLP